MHKHKRTIDKIAEDRYQFTVVSFLEILPGKIIVFCFRGICAKYIAQHIFATGKILYIFIYPYGPVTAGRYFIAFNI